LLYVKKLVPIRTIKGDSELGNSRQEMMEEERERLFC